MTQRELRRRVKCLVDHDLIYVRNMETDPLEPEPNGTIGRYAFQESTDGGDDQDVVYCDTLAEVADRLSDHTADEWGVCNVFDLYADDFATPLVIKAAFTIGGVTTPEVDVVRLTDREREEGPKIAASLGADPLTPALIRILEAVDATSYDYLTLDDAKKWIEQAAIELLHENVGDSSLTRADLLAQLAAFSATAADDCLSDILTDELDEI